MSTKPHFSLLATSFAGGPRPRHAAMILSMFWLMLYVASLFAPPLLDDADATHAQAAQAMATTGDLVTLHVDGIRYLEKAPLLYWLAAASFRIFGCNTFAAHLPNAIAVLLLMLLGHRWANQAFGARTGFYTAVAVLTSAGVFLFTRILIPEVLLSLFLAASLFAFLKTLGPIAIEPEGASVVVGFLTPPLPSGVRATRERPAVAWYAGPYFYPYVMWGSLAFAVLAKGLVALLFFCVTTGLYLTLLGEVRASLPRLRVWSGGVLFLVIAAPWHVLAAMRNPETPTHHGFLWFYFVNEHLLRFLGRRVPMDYNKLPGYLYWGMNLVWLFPWTLFVPLGWAAFWRRYQHQESVLTRYARGGSMLTAVVVAASIGGAAILLQRGLHLDVFASGMVALALALSAEMLRRRLSAGLEASPFHRIDPQQRTILLLSLFAAVVLLFFSLSTNQEYYTFPAYLPVLLLIAATITRAEQAYSSDDEARRWIEWAHRGLMAVGVLVAVTLLYGLWASRGLPYEADIGRLLVRRNVAGYTLSMAHLFDLTTASFAALRLPAALAAAVMLCGPALAWALRMQRRHLAATTAIACTAAGFLFAAELAFARFGPVLSSAGMAKTILQLETTGAIAPGARVLLYGDQAMGSSIPFYLGRQVGLVDGRSTSMLFGASFPDAPRIFLTPAGLQAEWGLGTRRILFVPAERRAEVEALLGTKAVVIEEMSGKVLLTDRKLGR